MEHFLNKETKKTQQLESVSPIRTWMINVFLDVVLKAMKGYEHLM